MRTLQDLLTQIWRFDQLEAIRFTNGYRTWVWSYGRLWNEISIRAASFESTGLKKGDRLILWGENTPHWVAAFWACVAKGIQVVPLDFRSSLGFVQRIQGEVGAKLLLFGDTVESPQGFVACQPLNRSTEGRPTDILRLAPLEPDDIVEVVFTSGTTGEPRGVVHRHRNICSNLAPFADEIRSYRRLARPFRPIRLLDLLPLSHMFGQSLGLFFPILLEGCAVFLRDLHSAAILETIKRERVSVLVTVPRLLSALEAEVKRRFQPAPSQAVASGIRGIAQRWWRYRDVHSALGWKFWALVAGGAEVQTSHDKFWGGLGYLVVQGYGLTETSPVVAVNHPFQNRPGSIGKALPGQEVRLSEEGEILVRGTSVVAEALDRGRVVPLLEDGWLHTGDLGELDAEGRLYFKGRKKDVIVTAEGLNVYPSDVEQALNSFPSVVDSAVVARRTLEGETVHAVFLSRQPGTDFGPAVRLANSALETHQRIRSWSIWPESDFPRTTSTYKVKRREVAHRLALEDGNVGHLPPKLQDDLLQRLEDPGVTGASSLSQDLGLSSLERLELVSRLEEKYQINLDEDRLAGFGTVSELQEAVEAARWHRANRETSERPSGAEQRRTLQSWRKKRPEGIDGWHGFWMKPVRAVLLSAIILPLLRELARVRVEGLENLDAIEEPVLFAANHNSHLDTPAIFEALPWRRRLRIAPAMRQEFFRPYFHPQEYPWKRRWTSRLQYWLAAGAFAAFPLPQTGGVRRTLRRMGRLADQGYSLLVFPEGRRSDDGRIIPFRDGIGKMSVSLRLPVVPVHLRGMFEIYSKFHGRPQPGDALVRFGQALRFDNRLKPDEVARTVEKAVRGLGEGLPD